jgi:hypothetical protein
MSKLTEYTLEVYKVDRRKKDGVRLQEKIDFDPMTGFDINRVIEGYVKQGFIVELYETYVLQKELLSGKEYMERYDTPHFCSPSNESYWSM